MIPGRRTRLEAARLYVITAETEPAAVTESAMAAVRGGAQVLQLRHKGLPRGRLLELARRLAAECADGGVLFIVNDHADIAVLAGADGVHVGPDDLSVTGARAVVGPDLLVGASAAKPREARAAEAAGADYLGSGPAYPTPVKTSKQVIGPGGVARVQAAAGIPVFAIGGIDRHRVPEMRAAGVDRICVLRSVSAATDPERAARELRRALA